MPELLFWLVVFVISIALLIKSSDWFIDMSEKIGISFGVPPFIIGVTIVALGTSLPELVSSIVAVMKGSSEIVVSNVVGSNIANTLLVLGTVAVMGKRIQLKYQLNLLDIIAFLGSAILLSLCCRDGNFTMSEGLLFIVSLIVYVVATVRNGADEELETTELEWHVLPLLIGSALLIWLSAQYNIESIIQLSKILGIGTEVIALSVVALGTSLPELFVSISAVRKGNPDMAIGNILGSNIFNILAVMGISSLIGTLAVPEIVLVYSFPVLLLATLTYFALVSFGELKRWQGIMCLVVYSIFIISIFT